MDAKKVAMEPEDHVHSKFFALCLFLLGLLITLMGLLGKRPITLPSSSPTDGAVTLTRASTFFRFSSASEMKSCFPTHRPTKVVPFGGSVESNGFPDAPAHSTELSGGVGSPEMETTTRGGARVGSSPFLRTSDHHEFPTITAVGGGHKNLELSPVDVSVSSIKGAKQQHEISINQEKSR